MKLKHYAAIGGGVLVLLLAVWLLPKMFGSGSDGLTQSQPITTADTARLEQSGSSSNQTAEGSKTLPVSALPENVTVGKPKEEKPVQPQPDTRSRKSGFDMVRVAGGTFTMGSPSTEQGRNHDECQHQITVGSFFIGKYEVTQAQWKAVMGNNPSEHKDCDDCPVENVSWDDVQDFLKKLNSLTGKRYRLPTEAEWEYAARGGAKSKAYTYAGSNTLSSVAWFEANSGLKTHSVGGKAPNELGLYDMSGNVWEWCQDTWAPYPCDSKTIAEGRYRVGHGGCAWDRASYCRSAYRGYVGAAERSRYLGFRLVSVSLQ